MTVHDATMRSIHVVPIILLLLCGSGYDAFSPPKSTISMTQPPRLQYVRQEDEMGWLLMDNNNIAGEQQHREAPRQQQRLQPQQSLDYEDMVNRRFSRHDRRARLRRSITYGAEMDRQRRELAASVKREQEELQHYNHDPPDPHTAINTNNEPTMINFRTNSDFPGSPYPSSQWHTVAKHPLPFPDAEYLSCTRYVGTSVLIPVDDYYARELLVNAAQQHFVELNGMNYIVTTIDDVIVPQPYNNDGVGMSDHAYWLQSKLHNAIYGQVRYGTILQRLDNPLQVELNSVDGGGTQQHQQHHWTSVEWIATSNSVAIKEMNWEKIREQREALAEDPIKEVAAMQYLERWWVNDKKRNEEEKKRLNIRHQREEDISRLLYGEQQRLHEDISTIPTTTSSSLQGIENESEESHIMMPLDLLSDDTNLYSITPYCTGGRLLDQIENKSRFSEPEARYWMRQILKGLTCLKNAGVAHRDMSPENLMVHDGNVYIIDLGMCLRIPPLHDNINDRNHYSHDRHQQQQQQRALIYPQTPCGKWYYLSPEVCLSEQPFDGPAVDLWAAGVILFIMLTGIPPWEEPKMTDDNFKLMSTGHLVQILTERRVGLSVDAMDLLQRMFWFDPTDRLSLEQVCAHPWVMHNEYNMEKNDRATASVTE